MCSAGELSLELLQLLDAQRGKVDLRLDGLRFHLLLLIVALESHVSPKLVVQLILGWLRVVVALESILAPLILSLSVPTSRLVLARLNMVPLEILSSLSILLSLMTMSVTLNFD